MEGKTNHLLSFSYERAMRDRRQPFVEGIVMSRTAPLLYNAIAYIVFFGIRMRLEKCNFVKLSGDEDRNFRTAVRRARH
jgi:hypothetical protein